MSAPSGAAHVDRAGPRAGGGRSAAGEAAPRPPAGLRRLVDLRVRRRHDRGADRGRRLRASILGLKGPAWWHVSGVGRFFNSIHLWAVEMFFFVMVVHLWGKFFMGAWRGGRALTWVTGAVVFLVAIGAAFTGYLSQQNFDSQWIASEGKDGLNSVGIGAYFNVATSARCTPATSSCCRSRWWRWSSGTCCSSAATVSCLRIRRRVRPKRSWTGSRTRRERLANAGAPAPEPDDRGVAWRVRPLRPDQRVRRRARGDHGADRDPGGAVLFARRQAGDDPAVGPFGSRRTSSPPRSRSSTAAARSPPTAPPTTTPRAPAKRSSGSTRRRWPGSTTGSTPPKTSSSIRSEHSRRTRRSSRRSRRTRPPAEPAEALDRRVHGGAREGPLSGRAPGGAAGHYGPVAPMMALAGRPGAERRARRRPADVEPVLPDELHQAAAVPLRRRLLRVPAPRRSTCSAPSGE